MPVQVFTDDELTVLTDGALYVLDSKEALSAQVNRTGVEKKAFMVATCQAKINSVQLSINGLDAKYTSAKDAELAKLNALMDVLTGLKTKLENLPE